MPTIAENGDFHNLQGTQDPCIRLTDDWPVCTCSGVGFSTNKVYNNRSGMTKEEHAFEDRSFHLCLGTDTFLYGVFDGEYGSQAVEFASQKIPAEINFEHQLQDCKNDQDVKDLLSKAFAVVESTFFQSKIDGLLAEKESIQEKLEGLRTSDAMHSHPQYFQRLSSLTAEIESGTSAVVALIYKNKLYVANVGNCRALLATVDDVGEIKVSQLSINHDFKNEDELLRLSQLGLEIEQLQEQSSNFPLTRCIGNYVVKGGYKEYNRLSDAIKEPVIAEPDVIGGIPISDSFRFLLLMSDGLYKSLEQATGTDDVNHMISDIVIDKFRVESTLVGVAQAVVDQVGRRHHDCFLQNNEFSENCQKRDDITLLIRNFNQSMTLKTVDPYVDFSDFYEAVEEAFKANLVEESWFREM